jgi:hypothetical protein
MNAKKRHPASCFVLSPSANCSCGKSYTRQPHPTYPFTYPGCECGNVPPYYIVRKSVCKKQQDFRYDRKSRKIKTLDDAYLLALDIAENEKNGTFKKSNYKRKFGIISISDTISEFIKENIIPRARHLHMTLDDKIWIEEWLEPYLCDVGVFTVSDWHLKDFIRTFNLKGEDRERAERLFNLIRSEIKF